MILHSKNEVLLRIQELYDLLSKSEQKVAAYVLDNSDETMRLSIASLAKQVNVSEPTVVRFCRKLDFDGYQDFKIALAQGSNYTNETLKIIHEEILESDSLKEISQKVVNSHILALQQTFSYMNYDNLEEFLRLLGRGGKVEFYGLGGSGTVAIDGENKFLRTGIDTRVCIDSHIQLMRTALLKENDLIVIFSNSGTTKHFVNVMDIAKKNGTKTVLITSFKESLLGRMADLVFEVRARETSYKQEPSSSRVAMLAIIDVIVTAIALQNQNQYIQNIYETRQALAAGKEIKK
ncbi:MAG: MurR/RpiR family transcriptional regulator [Faecalicatena sp.]|uniref:MurR/RpiR family transcriptional regulator n=1 Tax=Faecalicatena sp. TaxID=2005360 RepID=UPI00258BC917|nr:MurR/RpiR family transcriptional regulator [Faecalicatena sp.]MCI6465843.1 MurR/RpiR family transcriptional regulator [Faecalicatena sp.]MDY5618741.1 MurR/RpiR family transcriptional regulator [Lachnospiraceae bacterium]